METTRLKVSSVPPHPMTLMHDRPTAVVLGLNPNGLGIVKSLRAAGIKVAGLDRAPGGWTNTHTWMSSKTALCRPKVLLAPEIGWEGYLEALERLGRELGGRPPLFPSGDAELELISEYRARLEPHFRFSVPPPDVVDLLLNKGRFYSRCADWCVPAPHTLIHPSLGSFVERTQEMRFPLLVKPDIRDAAWMRRFGHAKAIECVDEAAVVERLEETEAAGMKVLVQEVVPGGDDQLYFSHGYVGRQGRLLALWTGRKLRQHPLGFGTSTLVESRWAPEVASQSLTLVHELELRGYFSVEFKWDARDGLYKVMEVTPGRTWYPHLLGVALDINIPEIWYNDLLGLDVREAATSGTPNGVRWVDEYRDVIAAIETMARGELDLRGWLRSYRGTRSLAVASVRDPVPILFVLIRMFRSFVNQLVLRRGRELTSPPPIDGTSPVAGVRPRPPAD